MLEQNNSSEVRALHLSLEEKTESKNGMGRGTKFGKLFVKTFQWKREHRSKCLQSDVEQTFRMRHVYGFRKDIMRRKVKIETQMKIGGDTQPCTGHQKPWSYKKGMGWGAGWECRSQEQDGLEGVTGWNFLGQQEERPPDKWLYSREWWKLRRERNKNGWWKTNAK